jgi:transcriptional regulator with XRE-family HTH domain
MTDNNSNLRSLLKEVGQLGKAKRLKLKSEKGKSSRMTIEELAGKIGTNKNTLRRFEKGLPIRFDTFIRFSKSHLIEEVDFKLTKFYLENDNSQEPKPKYQFLERTNRVVLREETGMKTLDYHDHLKHRHQLENGMLNAIVLEITGKTLTREHEGEELLFCLTGKIGVMIKNKEIILNKGDCINFWGKDPHHYFNALQGKERSVALSVLCNKNLDSDHITIHAM